MRFKKITVLVLLTLFAVSAIPALALEEAVSAVDTEAYAKNVDFITDLEIYSFPDEKPESIVTRAQFARMIADLLGISEEYSAADYFTDVSDDNPYGGAIGAVVSLGIMNGVGGSEFRPEESITYTQAIKTVVTALGYEPIAASAGGYPNGYMKCANSIGIIKNAPYDFDAPLTFEGAANLAALSAETEVYEVVYLTTKKVYYASSEDRVVLNVYHDIYLAAGLMTDNGITSFDGISTLAENRVKIGGRVLVCDDEDQRELLGCYVDYYYRETDDTLLYAAEKKNRNDVVVMTAAELMTDSADFSKTCVVRNVDGKTKKYKLDLYADLIYNGGLDKTFNGETLKIKDGTLRLIDADRDGDYEVIIAEEYRDTVFKNLNTDTEKMVSTYSEDDYAFINYGEYKHVVFQNALGEEIAPERIKEGSVVSVFKSKNKEKLRLVVSERVEEIVAEAVEKDDGGNITVGFGENTYELSSTLENLMSIKPALYKIPAVSATYQAYFNFEGNIAMLLEKEARLQYAYIMGARSTGTWLASADVEVKLHLESDDTAVVPVADKLTIDGERNKKGSDIMSSAVFFDSATGEFKPQLVMVRITADGKLKEIDTATDNTGSVYGFDLENFSLDFVCESAYSATKINGLRTYNGNQLITANTKIFVIGNDSKTVETTDGEQVKVIDYATYERRYGSCYMKLYDSDESWEAGAVVISEPRDILSRLFVVTKAYITVDFDGESRQAVNGWWTGDFRSFTEAEDGLLSAAVTTRYPGSDGKILPGDILEVGFDIDERINRARLLYSPKRDDDPDYTYFDMNGQTEIDDDHNYYILGYPCYISADRIGTYSKANADYTTVSGTNTATAETFWTTILQSSASSMSIFEFNCKTGRVEIISWDQIPSAAQLTATGYENINPDTKVFVKRIKGTAYDVVVVTNLSSQYN